MLYRQLPRVKRYLAYLPEGPVIDWDAEDLRRLAGPDGRAPQKPARSASGWGRRWSPAAGTPPRSRRASPTTRCAGSATCRRPSASPGRRPRRLAARSELGWRPQAVEGGFAAGQPQYNFRIPLRDADGAPRTEDDVLAGHEPAVAPQHQEGRQGRRRGRPHGDRGADLKAFHDLYVAHRRARPLHARGRCPTSRRCSTRCSAEEPDRIRLYLARHEGDLVAATIWVRVGGHTWYSYGASSTEKRDVRGSNAVQWAMIRDALAAGADVYDLRGITDTLDPDDSHVGLIQFKVGTGGEAVEYAGEWDLPLNRADLQGVLPLHGRR